MLVAKGNGTGRWCTGSVQIGWVSEVVEMNCNHNNNNNNNNNMYITTKKYDGFMHWE